MNSVSTDPATTSRRTSRPSPVAGGRARMVAPGSPGGLFRVLAATVLLASCDHEHGAHEGDGHEPQETRHEHESRETTPKPPSGVNPVQHEMRLLHEAMLGAVTAIANGDVTSVAKSLHRVHGAKEHTETALRSGAYTPPKNGQALTRFIELDEQFHTRLEHLVAESQENDVVGTAAALGKALEGCQGCHAEFRF